LRKKSVELCAIESFPTNNMMLGISQ
jgi:hypothetical protein